MIRAAIIAAIILFLQVTTFACTWNEVSPSFFSNMRAKSEMFQCATTLISEEDKVANINCLGSNFLVFFSNNSLYMQTVSSVRNSVLTKCWYEGTIENSCETQVNNVKCQSWDLRTY